MKTQIPGSLAALALALAALPLGACRAEMPMTETPSPQTSRQATVEEVYGAWTVDNAGSECLVSLSGQKTGDWHGVLVERCADTALLTARGWKPVAGGFELLDNEGQAIATFRMTGLDAFESTDGRMKGRRAAMP